MLGNELFWNTIHFAGLGLTFVGGVFLAFFSGLFRVEGERVLVRHRLAWLALGFFSVGFGMTMFYETHLLPGWNNLLPW